MAGRKPVPIISQGIVKLDGNTTIDHIYYDLVLVKNRLLVDKLADSGLYTVFGPKRC